jgi:hypothetical protein
VGLSCVQPVNQLAIWQHDSPVFQPFDIQSTCGLKFWIQGRKAKTMVMKKFRGAKWPFGGQNPKFSEKNNFLLLYIFESNNKSYSIVK